MRNIKKFTLLILLMLINILTFAQEKTSQPVKILFIGNSYTYQNNLPKILTEIAATTDSPLKIQTRLISAGGATLMSHWQKGEALAALRAEKWDYVVLQEQSTLGMLYINGYSSINDPNKFFFKYARMFDKEIKASGAKTVLMLTWAPKSRPEHQPFLNSAYLEIAKELKAVVIPIGIVWEKAVKERTDADLYDPDGNHPSPGGSYLAATVFYSTLFDKNPTGAVNQIQGHLVKNDGTEDESKTVDLVSIKKEDADWLRNLAWKTHQDLQKTGGYVKGEKPKTITLPQLPAGLKASTDDFLGTWKGTLNLYAVDYQLSPAKMELVLRQEPDGIKGTLSLTFNRTSENTTFQLKSIEIHDNQLFFSTPPKKYDNQDVIYQGVITKKGISGIAKFENEKTGGLTIGTWEGQR